MLNILTLMMVLKWLTYALEAAEAANADINFEVCDILEIDLEKYGYYFDVVFMEGGILHYFHDINEFVRVMYSLLKEGGKLICRLDSIDEMRPGPRKSSSIIVIALCQISD